MQRLSRHPAAPHVGPLDRGKPHPPRMRHKRRLLEKRFIADGVASTGRAGRDCRNVAHSAAPKNLAGALHIDAGGCTLSADWEVKMEIPAKGMLCILRPEFQEYFQIYQIASGLGRVKRMSRRNLEDKS